MDKAVRVLESQWQECEARLREVLAAGCESVLVFEGGEGGGVMRVSHGFGGGLAGSVPAAASELWGALGARGELGLHLATISQQLLHHVLEPLLGGGLAVRVEAAGATGTSPSQQQQHLLTWAPAANAPPAEVSCRQVLKLVCEVLFGLDPGLLRALGEALWRPFTSAYVSRLAQPAAAAALAARAQGGGGGDEGEEGEGVVQAARDLEEWAESLGLVEGGWEIE